MPSPSDDALRRIDALIRVALRIAGTAPSGRVALAKIASALEPEWLPQPWGATIWSELAAARDSASEPIAFRDVEKALRRAWEAKPTDELDELDSEPVAISPTSQVHRGVLDGEPVAVKVLRPGLAGSIRQDLALLEGLLAPLGAAFPNLDTQGVMRELRERVLDELDLEQEAGAMRRFHRALRGHPYLAVPAPVTRLAADGVLVSAWLAGTPFSELTGEARDAASAKLIVFVLGGLRAGIVHADPDPDDLLIQPDGHLAILDFGATAVVAPERADLGLAVVEAFAAQDATALGAGLEGLGLLNARDGESALGLAEHILGDLGGAAPSRLDTEALIRAYDRLQQRLDQVIELVLAGTLPPQELWPARGIGLAFGTIARLGATGSWRELVVTALRDGWDTTL